MNLQHTRRNLIVLTNTFKKLRTTYPLLQAALNVHVASMWCGKAMEALGSANPYAEYDGKRETLDDISPTFDDTSDTLDKEILDKGLIYTIDQMREYLKKETKENFKRYHESDDISIKLPLLTISQKLVEASMWLGNELKYIKEQGEDAPEVKL